YFTQEVILSFNILNFACAFAQAYLIAKIADLYGIGRTAKVYLVVSLALCISTARMFAYYPVLVDMGGYVLLLAAVYALLAEPRALARVLVRRVVRVFSADGVRRHFAHPRQSATGQPPGACRGARVGDVRGDDSRHHARLRRGHLALSGVRAAARRGALRAR